MRRLQGNIEEKEWLTLVSSNGRDMSCPYIPH